MNTNYHSDYIVYPVLIEDKIIQYLKDHELKTVIRDTVTTIKTVGNTLLKMLLKHDTLTIQILYSSSIPTHIIEHTTKKIKTITHPYNIRVTQYRITEDRIKILRGFN